ncbi:hypothetical protein FXO38_02756 [Capsicum annuum]|nr:hypothetical protein FXO38_02756 [Capsicum annuum]KAF3681566.1 hypothetical protein FXO37_02846 [Capsicum annuum]
MDGETPFKRVTRGIEHVDKTNYGTPSFGLGVSQLDSDNVRFKEELEEDKLKAETRRKSGNDNVNIRNSKVDYQSKDDLINASKISMDSSFVITDLLKKSPYVACYVEMKLFDTLKQKLSSVQLRRFMGTCFGQYATMPESWSNMDVNGTPSCLHVPIVREHDANVNVQLEKPIDEVQNAEIHIEELIDDLKNMDSGHEDVETKDQSFDSMKSNMDVNDIPSYLNVPVVHEHDASINVQLEKPIDEVSNTKSILKDQNAGIYIEELTDDLKNRNSGHEDVGKKDQSFDPMEVHVDETKVDCVKGDHSHIDVQHDLYIFVASVHMEDPIEIEHPKSIQDDTESQCTFPDELLPSLSIERRIIDMHRRKLAEETSKLSKRKRKLDIFDKYVDSTREYNLANQELTIVEYIIGFKLHASVPWHTVDYMFIPVNIGRIYWVLIVLSFNDRCLYVYDSLSSTCLDASVSLEVKKLSELLPTYLTIFDFYKKKKNEIDAVSDDESPDMSVRPQFECESSDMIITP